MLKSMLASMLAPFTTAPAKVAAVSSAPLAITALTVADEVIRIAAGMASLVVSCIALYPVVMGWLKNRRRRR